MPGSMVSPFPPARVGLLIMHFKGGTYAGNAVSCAAAVAVTNVFREEKVLENVSAR